MYFERYGNPSRPALVCIPGLLGGPENFSGFIPLWQEAFDIYVIDPSHEQKNQRLADLSIHTMLEVSYNSTADEIISILAQHKKSGAYLLGLSLGGKVVYDFAAKHPSSFLGGVITDVGPDSFEKSDLYKLIDNVVQNSDLNMPWDQLKLDFKNRIADRNMRSLLLTQISYPNKIPPAVWKTPMTNFNKLLRKQEIDQQFESLEKINAQLVAEKRWLHVFHASTASGISPESLPRIQKLTAIRLIPVHDATHFLHLSHKEQLSQCVLELNCGPGRGYDCE